MHELSLCQNILQLVQKHVDFPRKIKCIYLEIGDLASVEKSALAFNFELLKKGTVAEDAVLYFIDIPGEAICSFCEKTVKIAKYYEACSNCHQYCLTITKGQELRIKSMEVL